MSTSDQNDSGEIDEALISALQTHADGKATAPTRGTMTTNDIKMQVMAMSRGPFQQVLIDIMGCQPTIESIKAFADKSPDRWGQLVAIMAKLAGFNDKIEITGNIALEVAGMSDAQLMDALRTSIGPMREIIDVPADEDGRLGPSHPEDIEEDSGQYDLFGASSSGELGSDGENNISVENNDEVDDSP